MSADTGIFILVTKSDNGSEEHEYRVRYMGNIDAIYDSIDKNTGKWKANKKVITEAFCGVDTFLTDSEDKAREYAYSLIDELEENGTVTENSLEYGICFINAFRDKTIWDISEPLGG